MKIDLNFVSSDKYPLQWPMPRLKSLQSKSIEKRLETLFLRYVSTSAKKHARARYMYRCMDRLFLEAASTDEVVPAAVDDEDASEFIDIDTSSEPDITKYMPVSCSFS